MQKPIILNENADFASLISRTKGLDFQMSVIASNAKPLVDGPYQDNMNKAEVVMADDLYKRKQANQNDPNWNEPSPPLGPLTD